MKCVRTAVNGYQLSLPAPMGKRRDFMLKLFNGGSATLILARTGHPDRAALPSHRTPTDSICAIVFRWQVPNEDRRPNDAVASQ